MRTRTCKQCGAGGVDDCEDPTHEPAEAERCANGCADASDVRWFALVGGDPEPLCAPCRRAAVERAGAARGER